MKRTLLILSSFLILLSCTQNELEEQIINHINTPFGSNTVGDFNVKIINLKKVDTLFIKDTLPTLINTFENTKADLLKNKLELLQSKKEALKAMENLQKSLKGNSKTILGDDKESLQEKNNKYEDEIKEIENDINLINNNEYINSTYNINLLDDINLINKFKSDTTNIVAEVYRVKYSTEVLIDSRRRTITRNFYIKDDKVINNKYQ
ncbi:hypothetical protein MHL31_02850 [Lutibacter sp. A80]|uniref:hypothetical protein n=1 Tax=Lutibacter sp. A80 TaxID=2918453 RepID=UPI001F05CD06|nr:hypothetical protein [Lutibacter sp. A80]UMB61151.1 hypothetical protein MHL31_02850 [Lutibacter sp. A80]